jgi:uncharacterized protein with PIN domain
METTKTCPKCGNELMRIQRSFNDKLIEFISFNGTRFKRYRCLSCFWEGRIEKEKTNVGKKKLRVE